MIHNQVLLHSRYDYASGLNRYMSAVTARKEWMSKHGAAKTMRACLSSYDVSKYLDMSSINVEKYRQE